MNDSIIIVGTDRLGSLESSYARAFKQLGWTVTIWNPIASLHKVARGNRLGRLFSTFVNVEPWERKANLNLLRLADELRPQLILVIGTAGVRGGTLAQIKVRDKSRLIYCIYPDSPHNLDIARIHCLPFFDRVTTSSPAWVDAFTKLGATAVEYLPFAADPELHRPSNTNSWSNGGHEVVFIGNWRQEREQFLEQLIDFDLYIWGGKYWKSRTRPGSPLKASWGGRTAVGGELARICSESKVLLNFMDAATWPGPNMRMFEQAACRAFTLVNRTHAITELFTEGENVECFDSVEEAREKIKYYLEHDDARQRIAEASYRLVMDGGHTYLDRAAEVLRWASVDRLGR